MSIYASFWFCITSRKGVFVAARLMCTYLLLCTLVNMPLPGFPRQERDFDQHAEYCSSEPLAQEFLENNSPVREYFEVSTLEKRCYSDTYKRGF